ncbi:MAG: 3-hydroxyacyl-CoA dehydrogenase family protein [Candidatus Lokiarchaeota archaeon]|nr:3-hydroxyacyl-CoA dehydrogenase family protein [Candidatus Lokiarchaeota archaeon]
MRELHITNVAIIGSGIMGSGIAQIALLSGYQKVALNDVSAKILKKARESIQSWIQSLDTEEKFNELIANDDFMQEVMKNSTYEEIRKSFKSVGILAENFTIDEIMDRLICEVNIKKAISDSDFIIEAVPENLELKQEIFKQLGKYSPSHAILASNTSTMSPSKLGLSADRSEKVIGMHFHGAVPIRGRLIEITGGDKTTDETINLGCQIAENSPSIAGERFILRLEKETPGFVANRLTLARAIHLNWILDNAVEKKISLEQLIAGGLRLIGLDIVGLDTIYNTWKYLEENLSPDFAPGKVITELVRNGHLGKKTGKRFFKWNESMPVIKDVPVDDKTKEFLTVNRDKNLAMAIRMNEACRLIEEGVIKGYKTINKVDIIENRRQETFVLGMEKYKEWSKILEYFAQKLGKSYLKPCDMMKFGKFKEFP